jgi:drug/metabolite transporter (DMT)-like permease
LIHPALTLGPVLLVCGFLRASPTLFVSAASVLGAGLFGLVAVIGLALIGSEGKGETKTALRVAVLALLVTAALGASLSMALGGYMAINPLPLLEAHLAWGLGGWALLLLAGVSWAVVPMFQITPPYPKALTRPFPWLMVGALALLSLGLMSSSTVAIIIGKGLLVLAAASFAASTLRLQALRKRKTSDTTLSYFRVAMTALLAACLLGLALLLVPSLADQAPWPLELGVLLIVGVLASAVCGMLYKIVPFLVWLHLRSVAPRGVLPPTMNRMISTKRMNWQMGAHLLALALLLALPWLPQLTTLAGLALATSCAGLLANLLVALRIYRDFKSQNPVAA